MISKCMLVKEALNFRTGLNGYEICVKGIDMKKFVMQSNMRFTHDKFNFRVQFHTVEEAKDFGIFHCGLQMNITMTSIKLH